MRANGPICRQLFALGAQRRRRIALARVAVARIAGLGRVLDRRVEHLGHRRITHGLGHIQRNMLGRRGSVTARERKASRGNSKIDL